MRVYLDNQLVTYILSSIQNKLNTDPVVQQEINSMRALSQMSNIEFLVSEEVLAEIRKLRNMSAKRKNLELMYHKLKQGRGVIRNSTVNYNDSIATYNSPDVFYDHPFSDKDLDEVRRFLKSKGNQSDFDARYIANAMLAENKIDVFLAADKKTIWNHRADIMAKFRVMVKLPSELATELLCSSNIGFLQAKRATPQFTLSSSSSLLSCRSPRQSLCRGPTGKPGSSKRNTIR